VHPGRTRLLRATTAFALACTLLAPAPAAAQSIAPQPDGTWLTRSWVGDVVFLSATTLLGALTAGVYRKLGHGSFQEGFTRGALGGAVAYGRPAGGGGEVLGSGPARS